MLVPFSAHNARFPVLDTTCFPASSHPQPGTPLSRAEGCLLGQLAGDSLGGLVEFMSEKAIRVSYPGGVRLLADGGTWELLAGQPTDDSEMALLLARALVRDRRFTREAALGAYRYWHSTEPFDCGMTIGSALCGHPNPASQSNGALMRISPLGIFAASHGLESAASWAAADAGLTHTNPVCIDANRLYTMALASAVADGCGAPEALYSRVLEWARDLRVCEPVLHCLEEAWVRTPTDYVIQQGWVLIALQNAFWQLLHAPSFEEGVVDTVMRGGDTDTNAAICGALLGAVHGEAAIPGQWRAAVLSCRPEPGREDVMHPRPPCLWPVDARALAACLLGAFPAAARGTA